MMGGFIIVCGYDGRVVFVCGYDGLVFVFVCGYDGRVYGCVDDGGRQQHACPSLPTRCYHPHWQGELQANTKMNVFKYKDEYKYNR